MINLSSGDLFELPAMSEKRKCCGVAYIESTRTLFVIGGEDIDGKSTDSVEKYFYTDIIIRLIQSVNDVHLFRINFVENQWRMSRKMHDKRRSFGVVVSDNKIYVAGGKYKHFYQNSLEAFDLKTGLWKLKSSMQISRSSFAVL